MTVDPAWDRLLAAARRKLEQTSGQLTGSIGLSKPSEAERRIVIGATGQYRAATVKTLRLDLVELDEALLDTYGKGLLATLAERAGPVRDRKAERADEAQARTDALDEARRLCHRHRDEPWFSAWLEKLATDGTVTRLVRRGEADTMGWAAQVLNRLPADNLPLPILAEWATGNTKALSGTSLSTVVLRALATRDDTPPPVNRAEQRARWEAAGVVMDDLSSQVLVLNLQVKEDHVVAEWLRDAAGFGLPFRLTLHQLTVDPLTPIANDIYVCENPAVLRVCASELAENSAALICTEGQPSAACHVLLAAATGRIHWRGDFDWTGLRTTAAAITRYGAIPWQMSTQDYQAAVDTGHSEPLKGPPVTSPWDPVLADTMAEHGRAIMEERLIPSLLKDLDQAEVTG